MLRHTSVSRYSDGENTWELIEAASGKVLRTFTGSWSSAAGADGCCSGASSVQFSEDQVSLIIRYAEGWGVGRSGEFKEWEERLTLSDLA